MTHKPGTCRGGAKTQARAQRDDGLQRQGVFSASFECAAGVPKLKIATTAASAILAATALLHPVGAWAADPTALALNYLGRHQLADGAIDISSAGFGNPGTTEDFVIGASAAGIDPNTLRVCGGTSAYDWLATDYADASKNAGRTAKLILALDAGGRDPHGFAGHDVVAGLLSTYVKSTGAFGDGGAFTQSLAILALRASGQPVGAKARHHLESIQDGDGGWGFGGTSDTNSTALALEALKAVSDTNGRAAALSYLHTQQDPGTGGFILSSGYGPPPYFSDPDSDALVIQGLLAAGQDPSGAAWTVGGRNAPQDLLTFQDTASAGAALGGFIAFKPESATNQPDTTTTSQVPAALAGRAFPILPTYRAGASLAADACPAAQVTPSPAPLLPTAGSGPAPAAPPLPSTWLAILAMIAGTVGTALLVGRRSNG